MGIIAGELRHVVTITQLTTVRDAYGAVTESYSTLYTLRAGVKSLSGTKGIELKEIFTSQVLQFTMYYREITETMRITYKSKAYRILNIEEIGYREGLKINAELIND